jgi:hypothetical protein
MKSADAVPVTAQRIDDALLTLATDALSGLDANERLIAGVVERFGALSHSQRCKLAQSLSAIAAVLQNEVKFVVPIFDCHIKIRVQGDSEAAQLQQKLFSWGGGFHHGSYPLTQHVELANQPIHSIHVTPTGCIGFNFDVAWYEQCDAHEVSADSILNAASPPHPYRRIPTPASPA